MAESQFFRRTELHLSACRLQKLYRA